MRYQLQNHLDNLPDAFKPISPSSISNQPKLFSPSLSTQESNSTIKPPQSTHLIDSLPHTPLHQPIDSHHPTISLPKNSTQKFQPPFITTITTIQKPPSSSNSENTLQMYQKEKEEKEEKEKEKEEEGKHLLSKSLSPPTEPPPPPVKSNGSPLLPTPGLETFFLDKFLETPASPTPPPQAAVSVPPPDGWPPPSKKTMAVQSERRNFVQAGRGREESRNQCNFLELSRGVRNFKLGFTYWDEFSKLGFKGFRLTLILLDQESLFKEIGGSQFEDLLCLGNMEVGLFVSVGNFRLDQKKSVENDELDLLCGVESGLSGQIREVGLGIIKSTRALFDRIEENVENFEVDSNPWTENVAMGRLDEFFLVANIKLGSKILEIEKLDFKSSFEELNFKPLTKGINLSNQDGLGYEGFMLWALSLKTVFGLQVQEFYAPVQNLIFMVLIWLKPSWPPPRTLRTRFFEGVRNVMNTIMVN